MASFSDSFKRQILGNFNAMPTKDIQDTYLAGLISVSLPQRSRNRLNPALKAHSAVFYYRVSIDLLASEF
mgnify:CR=1 FL=1